ncbi:MAG: hypothetical protein PHZ07_02880 [Patescibacteria group bacterium]|nr:hypothetical protein [Patescibacteria group bacterium]MDD4304310.1 hypothetical protein [Patescibacteria group bacterium]MDD4695663.1 hypothetical protein [Patescibacteria group bacterium]
MKKITKIRIFINLVGILGIVLLFSWLIKKDLILDGKLIINSDLTKTTPMISIIYPEHRVEKGNEYYNIIEEPVYFNLRSPIKFDEANIEIEFQNEGANIIQLSVADNGEGWSYIDHTLYNKTLDDITWPQISDNINTLWQKETKFDSINGFINEIHSLDGVGAYDFNLGENFTISNYEAKKNELIINNCIRGEHKLYTYIKNEALNFTFTIQDINRTDGSDPISIEIFNINNKKIYSKIISDDGMISSKDPASDPRYISLYIPNLEEGVYRIEFLTNDDVLIRQIKTNQQKISFIDRLYLCDNPEYSDGLVDLKYLPTTIYTNARTISFYTAHDKGLQTVTIDDKTININKKHEWIKTESGPKLSKIYIPKNDLKISGRGVFALNKEQYFNPEIVNSKDYSDSENMNYIIAQYQKPEIIENNENETWFKGIVHFSLNDAKIEDGNLKFMVSSPNLNLEKNKIKIRSIKVELIKNKKQNENEAYEQFWNIIKQKIKSYINLFNKI